MNLREIMAVSGQPGLYKFVAQSTHGVIVESLLDGRRSNIPPTARVSSMGEIAIFTDAEDMPIGKVFQGIYRFTDGKEAISHKSSPEDVKKFFAQVLPDYDRERVHVSDMKKVLSWYNVLLGKDMIDLTEEEEDAPAEAAAEEKPAEKAPAKKVAAKKEDKV